MKTGGDMLLWQAPMNVTIGSVRFITISSDTHITLTEIVIDITYNEGYSYKLFIPLIFTKLAILFEGCILF